MREWVVATTNQGKVVEIQKALKGQGLHLIPLRDMKGAPFVEETEDTFEGNARKKAREIALWSGKPSLADDSGLVVPTLNGRPGVLSARYAGEGASDEENCTKLLREMNGISWEKRAAFFVCVMVLIFPSEKREIVVE